MFEGGAIVHVRRWSCSKVVFCVMIQCMCSYYIFISPSVVKYLSSVLIADVWDDDCCSLRFYKNIRKEIHFVLCNTVFTKYPYRLGGHLVKVSLGWYLIKYEQTYQWQSRITHSFTSITKCESKMARWEKSWSLRNKKKPLRIIVEMAPGPYMTKSCTVDLAYTTNDKTSHSCFNELISFSFQWWLCTRISYMKVKGSSNTFDF